MEIYNTPSIYKQGISKEELDTLFKFEDITNEITLESGVTLKSNSSILYNKYLNQMNVNIGVYKTSSLSGDVPMFKLPERFKYKNECTSPFCQGLNSSGIHNTNQIMYLLTLLPQIMFSLKTITGTNYGGQIRTILYVDE